MYISHSSLEYYIPEPIVSKEKFENLLRKINYIISGAATGQDPYTIEPEEEVGCSGSCSSCSGCH